MKIAKLALKNFRSHADTVLSDLGRINVIRSANGGGKSSLAYAVEYVLTGRFPLTDERGAGADKAATNGSGEMSVQAMFAGENARLLNRSRNAAGGTITVNGDPNSKFFLGGSAAEAWIAEHAGDREVLSAVLRAGRFVGMDEKDQKKFLSAALAGKAVDIPVDIANIVKNVTDKSWTQVSNPQEADDLYQQFYRIRADLNREIRALGELEAPVRPEKMPTLAACTKAIDDLEKQKSDLQDKRTRAIAAFENSKNKGREDAARAKAERLKKHEEDAKHLKDASRTLGEQKQLILADGELAAIEKTLKGKTKIEAADKAIAELQAEINFKRTQVSGLKEDKACPTCQRPYDKPEGAADQIDALASEIGDREEKLKKLQADRNKMGDPATAEERHRAHKSAVVAVAQAEKIMQELRNMPARCDTSDLDKVLNVEQPPDLFAGQADTAAIDAEIEALIGRITKGKVAKDQIVEFEGRLKQHALAEQKRGNLQERVNSVQKVVDAFAPAGPIRAQLVGDRLEPFKKSLLAALGRFGFECELSLEPYKLTVKGLGLRQLCGSEQFRFSVAFQVAIAEAAGIRFAVFDASDILTSKLRPMLSRLLMESSLEQAFVMVATDDLSPVRVPDGVKVFDLVKDEHGVTRVVGTGKEGVAA